MRAIPVAMTRTMTRFAMVVLAAALGGAAAFADPGAPMVLFDPADGIAGWKSHAYAAETVYAPATLDGRPAIRARAAAGAASLLYRPLTLDLMRCPVLTWQWSATRIHAGADLRVKAGDDTAAALYLLFGDPGSPFARWTLTALRYVWTNDRVAAGTMLPNAFQPDKVKSVVVESGDKRAGAWVTERRDAAADYRRAFGRPPDGPVRAIAIYTDSDQTGEAAEAYYGAARAVCEK